MPKTSTVLIFKTMYAIPWYLNGWNIAGSDLDKASRGSELVLQQCMCLLLKILAQVCLHYNL